MFEMSGENLNESDKQKSTNLGWAHGHLALMSLKKGMNLHPAAIFPSPRTSMYNDSLICLTNLLFILNTERDKPQLIFHGQLVPPLKWKKNLFQIYNQKTCLKLFKKSWKKESNFVTVLLLDQLPVLSR